MKKYDFLIVGSGLFGATVAHELFKKGKSVLVIEKRKHIGGNIYTEKEEGITIHCYGAHIFHTDKKEIWDYVNSFVKFNNFENNVIANYHDELYHLPFNMNTFTEIWDDVKTVEDAKSKIENEIQIYGSKNPKNLEEQAISLVGKTIYTKLIKEYTEKQWHKDCKDLPSFIIKRLPIRYEFNNNYFNDKYQGVPEEGYTKLVEKLLDGIEVKLETDYLANKEKWNKLANKIVYTGPVDELFDFEFGPLEYRSLKFIKKYINKEYFQSTAVVNYTSHDVKFTRIIEHKHFNNEKSKNTIIFEEYPWDFDGISERYYTVNDDKNNALYNKYLTLAKQNKNLILGGRLGYYKYIDMDDVIEAALNLVKSL